MIPPRRREGALPCIPFRVIGVPVAHDLIHLATVHTARLLLNLLDEVAEERGAWRKRHVVDVAVQGLVHSEHELGHPPLPFLSACFHAWRVMRAPSSGSPTPASVGARRLRRPLARS